MKDPKNFAVALMLLFGIGSCVASLGSKQGAEATTGSKISEGRGLADISLSMISMDKTGFGNVLEVTMRITNRNRYAIKDVTVRCEHAARSGSVIDYNSRTVYEKIGPSENTIVQNFNMGFINTQATKSACEVTDFTRA